MVLQAYSRLSCVYIGPLRMSLLTHDHYHYRGHLIRVIALAIGEGTLGHGSLCAVSSILHVLETKKNIKKFLYYY